MTRQWSTRLAFYTTPPLSLNDRTHWRVKAKHGKAIREYVREWAFYQVPACSAAEVELHYTPRDRRRRDVDNLVPNLKHAIDGLVDAGVVPDDTPEYIRWTVHIDPPNRDDPHLWLVVREG